MASSWSKLWLDLAAYTRLAIAGHVYGGDAELRLGQEGYGLSARALQEAYLLRWRGHRVAFNALDKELARGLQIMLDYAMTAKLTMEPDEDIRSAWTDHFRIMCDLHDRIGLVGFDAAYAAYGEAVFAYTAALARQDYVEDKVGLRQAVEAAKHVAAAYR